MTSSRALSAVPADAATLVPALRAALDGSGPAVLPVDAASPPSGPLPAEVPERIALVVRTSGSSGVPKAVALSADALVASARATEQELGGPGAWVLALPGHYIAGAQVIVRALLAGGELRVLPAGPFTAVAFAEQVAALPEGLLACSSVVPTQLHRLVEAVQSGDRAVRTAVDRLDALLVGGGRVPGALAERAAAAGVPLRRTYGASETSGGCVYDGRPLPGVQVRVVGGEVQLAGPMLADGYLGDPQRTARVLIEERGLRWYRTGDAGEWDGHRLAIHGRLDDVVITGGEKVSLGLVEQAVQALPGLEEAVVVRAPDPEWGEVPVVVTAVPTDLAVLRATVTQRLGRAAAPRRAVVVDPLPRLASGKPDRAALTALVAT